MEEFWQLFSYKIPRKTPSPGYYLALLGAGGAAIILAATATRARCIVHRKRLRQELSEKAIKIIGRTQFTRLAGAIVVRDGEAKQLVGE